MIWYCSSAYVEYVAEYMVNLVEVLPPANCIVPFARQVCRPTGYIRIAPVEVGRQVIRHPTSHAGQSEVHLLIVCSIQYW